MPTLGVFAAIFDDDGHILCVRMNYARRAWTTPGGRVEPGGSSDDALKREVLEESGLDVVADELVGVYSKPYKDDMVLFLRVRVVGRNQRQPSDEISHMDYFGRYELPQPMGRGARTRIIDALDGVTGRAYHSAPGCVGLSGSDHAWTINDCCPVTAQPPITGK